MVVAIDASRVEPYNKTGVEYYSAFLLRTLVSVVPADIKVILYSRIPIEQQFSTWPANWENKVLRWPIKLLWSQLRLAMQTFIDRPDVTFIPSHIIPFFIKGRVIVSIHDISWKEMPIGYSLKSRIYLNLMTWWASVRASAIITISNYSKHSITKYYKTSDTFNDSRRFLVIFSALLLSSS